MVALVARRSRSRTRPGGAGAIPGALAGAAGGAFTGSMIGSAGVGAIGFTSGAAQDIIHQVRGR